MSLNDFSRRRLLKIGIATASIGSSLVSKADEQFSQNTGLEIEMEDYKSVRKYEGDAERIIILGSQKQKADISGTFQRGPKIPPDQDDGGCVLVDGKGRSWLRLFTGPVKASWFGAIGDGTGVKSDDCAPTRHDPRFLINWDTRDFVGIQRAIDFAATSGVLWVSIAPGEFIISKTLWIKHSGMRVEGAGIAKTKIIQSATTGCWFEELADRGQIVIGGRAYGSANYGTGKAWNMKADGTLVSEQKFGRTFDFAIDNVVISDLAVVGDRKGFYNGGHYTSSKNGPILVNSRLFQSGVVMLGVRSRLSRNITVLRVNVEGHAKQGIAPGYLDGWSIDACTGSECGWQFIGTDYGVKRGIIKDCDAMNYADGDSENAFLDLEAGNGVDFEDIEVVNCAATSAQAGFIKLHPGNNRSISNIRVLSCTVNVGGARTFSYLELFGEGKISNVLVEDCAFAGARKTAFLFACVGGQKNIAIRNSKKLEMDASNNIGEHFISIKASLFDFHFEVNRSVNIVEASFLVQKQGGRSAGLYFQANVIQVAAVRLNGSCFRAFNMENLTFKGNEIQVKGRKGRSVFELFSADEVGGAQGLIEFLDNIIYIDRSMLAIVGFSENSIENTFNFSNNSVKLISNSNLLNFKIFGSIRNVLFVKNNIYPKRLIDTFRIEGTSLN